MKITYVIGSGDFRIKYADSSNYRITYQRRRKKCVTSYTYKKVFFLFLRSFVRIYMNDLQLKRELTVHTQERIGVSD